MERGASSSSSSSGHLGGRAIDRHNPIITDSRRIVTPIPTPAQTPSRLASPEFSHMSRWHGPQKGKDKCNGVLRPDPYDDEEKVQIVYSCKGDTAKSWLKQKGSMFWTGCDDFCGELSLRGTTPAVSTRHLLGDSMLFDNDRMVFTHVSPVRTDVKLSNKDRELKKLAGAKSLSFPSKASSDQVVVLRVSLHCRGCARKVRKHLSKMEGVTSFNIDFAMKKVTVVGDVTPSSVLASISKVKNAQFWPFPPPLHS